MSRLPLEDRNVWGQPGPEYEPVEVCAHPFCEQLGWPTQLELHHLWPRSFLRNQPKNWVKLPDGRVVGNLVYLCREHHRQITENEGRIEWTPDGFAWTDGGMKHFLNPQPPLSVSEVSHDPGHRETSRRPLEGLTEPPAGGETCPTCKRRVPHPKKESSPQTSVVKSWRMPAEEKEAREETIAATAEHLGISQKEKFWMDKLILTLCVLALQGPGHE